MVTGLFIFFPCLSNTIKVHVYSNHGIYELQPWPMGLVKMHLDPDFAYHIVPILPITPIVAFIVLLS